MCCCSRKLIMWTIGVLAVLALSLASITYFFGGVTTGIQVELVDADGGMIPNGSNVLFDTAINDQGSGVSYDPATGDFTVTRRGTYYVDWWVAPDGADLATSVSFAVAVNGVPYSTPSSPIVSGQMAASALVTIDTVPATISLVNVTGDDIYVSSLPVQAGIVISK